MNTREIINKIKPVLQSHREIKLAYLFGSQVTGNTGGTSDYDFALYIDEQDKKKLYDLKFILIDKISRTLQTDRVDIVVLNITDSPELKYNIIKEGILIFSEEPFQVLIEPKILNEYFDFHDLLARYNLTEA
jgi:predicted nucleotidyltransferase